MGLIRAIRVAFACALAMAMAGSAGAVVLGQVDDFQDGTTQNWSGGASPQNVPGGQGGGSDLYLRCTSHGGFGAGSHMAVFNQFQWNGDYQAAGVTAVAVDLKNEGATQMEIRAVLFGVLGSRWVTQSSIVLPPDGVWRRFVFKLTQDNMVRVLGADTYQDVITGVERLMFRHDPGAPSSQGVAIAATLGLDNITALGPVDVGPSAFSLFRGILISGGLPELLQSDNAYMTLQPGIVLNAAEEPVQVILTATSPFASPALFQFKVESRGSVGGLGQRISLFNYQSNQYELLDARSVTLSDSAVTVAPTGDLSRFVSQADRQIRARVTYRQVAPVPSFPWTIFIDQTQWRIGP